MRHFITRVVTALATATSLAGCSTDRFLTVEDPDLITPENVRSAAGAEALRIGALSRFRTAIQSGSADNEGIFQQGGLLADEWKSGNTFQQTNEIDQRVTRADNSVMTGTYRQMHRARVSAIQAMKALTQFSPTARTNIAQMHFVKGFIELMLAESYCNGLTLSDASEATAVETIDYGGRITVDSVFKVAIASFDQAISFADGTDAAATNIRQAAILGRARALVNLERYAEAAAAVPPTVVPTTFRYAFTYAPVTGDNGIWSLNNSQRRYVVGDPVNTAPIATTEANSLPFATANDPRVPVTRGGSAFDTPVPFARQEIWPARDTSLAILRGLDARLIEAEAALDRGNSNAYLPIINALRAANVNPRTGAAAPLAPLTDPGTPEGRITQFFNEKAFFQFGRGYRLGDLRRLIRQYDRPQNQVFPSGAYFKGGEFGSDVNLPIPQAEQNNPNYRDPSGNFLGCIDRGA